MDGLVTFALFPDGREGEGPVTRINNAIRELNVSAPQYYPPFRPLRMAGPRAWHTHGPDSASFVDAMMRLLRQADWEYPATVIHRADSDSRWNFLLVGLNSPNAGEEGREPSFLDGY